MGDEKKIDAGNAQAVAAAVNSPAAEKLADALKNVCMLPQNIVDYMAGPKRIVDKANARAEAAIIEAKAQAEIDRIRAETADYVLDREMRKTVNRKLIVAEAYKALPPPDENLSKEKPSEGFIHNFFDEFDGIGDPEMQKLVGRLLAGEVVRPGSFHRKTIRVVRDLESKDFEHFNTLCRFAWNVGDLTPLVFKANHRMYVDHGVDFAICLSLAALGLIQFSGVNLARECKNENVTVMYGTRVVRIEVKGKKPQNLDLGQVDFTMAGRQLCALTRIQAVPGFIEYVAEKWRSSGHAVTIDPVS